MPYYNYECSECGHEFEQFRTIEQYDMPCKEACLSCFKIGYVVRTMSSPRLADSVKLEMVLSFITSAFTSFLDKIKNWWNPPKPKPKPQPGITLAR